MDLESLRPHPRWRWGTYPMRWLVGGCWGLWQLRLRGLLYGGVFFVTGWIWSRTLSNLSPTGFGLAVSLTSITRLLCPRLTVGLLENIPSRGPGSRLAQRPGPRTKAGTLLGIGALLVLLMALALNASLLGFALLFSGEIPPLERLIPTVFSWRNAPLALLLGLVLFLSVFSMQVVAAIPTFVVREVDTDLIGAIRASLRMLRANWRPLACWAFCSQLILLLAGGLDASRAGGAGAGDRLRLLVGLSRGIRPLGTLRHDRRSRRSNGRLTRQSKAAGDRRGTIEAVHWEHQADLGPARLAVAEFKMPAQCEGEALHAAQPEGAPRAGG